MTRYSERGRDYIRTLHRIIDANDLRRLDQARLIDHDDSGLDVAGDPEVGAADSRFAVGEPSVTPTI
jgi:hypothetical protein